MEELNIRELREIAEKATPGPWVATECLDVWVESDDGIAIAQCGDFHWVGADGIVNTEEQMKANARFFTTFDPPTVLALLSSAEAREEAERAFGEMHGLAIHRLQEVNVAKAALQAAETRAQQAEARVEALERRLPELIPLFKEGARQAKEAKRKDWHARFIYAAERVRQALGASHG